MSAAVWNSLGPPLPPAGRGNFASDGRDGIVLFLLSDKGPELRRWTGTDLALVTSKPFGDDEYVDAFFGCFDPRSNGMLLFGLHSDGLLTVPESGGAVQRVACEDVQSWAGAPFAVFHPRKTEVWLVVPGERSCTYALRGGTLKRLARSEPLVWVTWDPKEERLVGVTVMGAVYAFDGKGKNWSLLGQGRQDGQLAWHPRLEAVLQLISDGHEGLHLARWENHAWVPMEPETRVPTYRSGFALGVDANRDEIVMFGGQDFDKGGSPTNEAFLSKKGSPFETTNSRAYLPVGRYNTACTLDDGTLVVVNHSALVAARFGGECWTQHALRKDDGYVPGFDDRGLNFAASKDGLWALDSEGEVQFASWGSVLSRAAPAKGGPGSRYSGRVAMAFDSARNRLVLFGGSDRNDTWLFHENRWQELTDGPRPPAGIGGLCATPEGVFLWVQKELWRLDGDTWQMVGKDTEWGARTLLFDAKRQRLWSVADGKVAVFDEGKFRVVAGLPAGVKVPSFAYTDGDTVGIDGTRDVLVGVTEAGVFTLSLEDCSVRNGTLPTSPIEGVTVRPAPPKFVRKAVGFQRGRKIEPVPASIAKPKGYFLLALLPAHPKAMPLQSAAGLAVFYAKKDVGKGWGLGKGTTKVVLLPAATPVKGLVYDEAKEGLVAFRPVVHDELDPEHEGEFDSLPGDARGKSFESKCGGYPRFIQENVKGKCPKCKKPLRFVAQLSSDTYCFGDVGRLYVFVCPEECWAGAAVQCH